MKNTIHNLAFIRKKINSIDSLLKKLLQRRSLLIPKVKTIKQNWPYKIAFKREAEITNKIQHSKFGYYNKSYMQKIWREIISATLNIECGLKIGIYGTKNATDITTFGLWEISKDHFGSATDFCLNKDINSLFEELSNKKLDAIILPDFNHKTKWWFQLKNNSLKHIKINLVLPNIRSFNTLFNIQGVCLSLNNKDILENKYYVSKKIIEYTIDTKDNWYLIESNFDLEDLKIKYNLTDDELIFVGSSAFLV